MIGVAIGSDACHHDAMSPLSPAGRMAPLPFAVAAIAVYAVGFGSQMLLSPLVTARMSVVPFALLQAVLVWLWLVLHARRLRDAGRPAGTAAGIAIVYALAVALLVIVVWLMLESGAAGGGGTSQEADILHLFVIFYLLAFLAGDSGPGALQIWILGFAVLMVLPVIIALAFSLWAATRKSVAP
jgi:uncharacterized membrane protein YhaH (DUF805 family)